MRATLARVVEQRGASDPHLVYVDGLSLFSRDDAHLLPDGLHPDERGFRLIADRFVMMLESQGLAG